jgi:hypothetical protein
MKLRMNRFLKRLLEEGIIDKFIQKPMTMNYLCREFESLLHISTNDKGA